jgi:protein-S-isoprenylcysteine O-methyltransferase Ste14
MTRAQINIFSVLGYVLMVIGLLLLVYNRELLSSSIFLIPFQAAAIGFMIWARVTFRSRSFHLMASPTEGGLVTTGPYRYVRHPIYASALLFVFAGVSGNLSVGSVCAGLLVFLGAYIRILSEESLVIERYPEYREYAAKTRRLIPFIF